ncbi:MAG TPA: hypothetical protein VGR14_16245 [Verrucomicrobiae bacterium]|nr:hypothetical protein [Verrucomicrobiae bacterium]
MSTSIPEKITTRRHLEKRLGAPTDALADKVMFDSGAAGAGYSRT